MESSVCRNPRELQVMSAHQHVSASIESQTRLASSALNQALSEEREYHLPDAYHKILDYHVAEILLSTIVLAAIAFLRFHPHH
jgi:hypothetical protein